MLNPFKTKESRTTTVRPEDEVLPAQPDERTLRQQQIEAYSDPLTDMYTEKRNHMYACIQEFQKTLAKRNEVYVKLMDGKKYIPDLPNIRAYFEDLDNRFAELTATLEKLRLSCISSIEECQELYKRLSNMKYEFIDKRMVTSDEYKLEEKQKVDIEFGGHLYYQMIDSNKKYEKRFFEEKLTYFDNFV